MTERPPRVSVVVPVFDPGPYIEPAIRSILGQTMPAGDVEAIFVDDGSSDGTQDRLDRLAAEHPATIRVIHIAPSGAPGRPRNVGLDAARGDYVQFLDADDELALDAFEHLVPVADRNGADVVVEKFASASVPRSQRLFDASIERTTLAERPDLVDSSLGPAKLYRRTFLLDNGIRFPEGWRQMEDQLFTIHAYARARAISVAAERPWYFYNRRDDDGHLTSERVDPDRHFRNLRTVLDLVDAETGPGPIRDRIIRRMVRVEVLNRVSEPLYPELPDDDRARLFAGARDLVRERISTTVIDGFGAIRRQRCRLLRDDRPAELLAMARQLADVGLSATVVRADWHAGAFDLALTAGLIFESSGAPLRVDDGPEPEDPAAAGDAPAQTYAVNGDPGLTRIQLVLRSRPSVLDWYIAASGEPFRDRVGASVRARIDPLRVGAGATPLAPGSWDVLVRISGLGLERSVALKAGRAGVAATPRPALVGAPPHVVVPIVDADGIRLEVDPPSAVLAAALAGRPVHVIGDGARLALDLPMASGRATGTVATAVVVGAPDGDRVLPAWLVPHRGRVVLEASVEGLGDLVGGRYPVALRLGGTADAAVVALGVGVVVEAGIRIEGLERQSSLDRFRSDLGWVMTRDWTAIERTGRRVGRRVKRRLRA